MTPLRLLALAAVSAAAVTALVDAAAAAPRGAPYGRYGDGYGYVVAESRYTSATVSGPVRRGSHGRLEVRLPGGTWLECGRSCSETLRRESVDFWYSRGGRNDPVDGPGYLTFRWWW